MSQTLQSVLCITTNKYLVRVLVVLLHARFSVVSPIPFLLAAIFFPVHPYIGSTTVLPDIYYRRTTALILSWRRTAHRLSAHAHRVSLCKIARPIHSQQSEERHVSEE